MIYMTKDNTTPHVKEQGLDDEIFYEDSEFESKSENSD